MEKLVIPYTLCGDSGEAYRTVKEGVREVLSQWNIHADITCRDQTQKIHAKGKGFSMDIAFGEKEALAEITLSFPLSALKKTILPPLERELKKYL